MIGLTKISLPTKTKLNIVSKPHEVLKLVGIFILSALLISVVGFSFIGINKIEDQKVQISTMQKTIEANDNKINSLTKKSASQSAQITALENQPTPTPVIEYRTNTVTKTQYIPVGVPEMTHCNSDFLGGTNCFSY